jgi:hypothetical protein
MQQNAKAMDAVIAKIRALGVAGNDVQTAGISLNANYDYDQQARKQVFRGYRASNTVNVTLRDVAKAGSVLDALVAAGATDINGPNFGIDDDKPAKDQARKAAMETAKAQAMNYAQMAGYSNIRLLAINEAVSFGQPIMVTAMKRMEADAVAAPTPIEPGLVGTSVTVTVKYELVR